MPRTTIDRLIINSPYEEPARHWRYERETRTFDLAEGRRPAGYVVASVWIGELDRLHRSRGILRCYDLSAAPFTPSGKKSSEEALFGWIVSDFGLNDAIESDPAKREGNHVL